MGTANLSDFQSTGEARSSFTSKQLDACTSAEGEVNIKWLAASLYGS